MTYMIRHARTDDAEAVFEIFSSMHLVRGTMRLPYLRLEEMQRRLTPADGTIQLVAEAERRVVGFVELINHPNLFRHRHAGELNMVATHPDWRGKRVAKTLMAAVIEMADKWMNLHRLGLTVWATNKEAISLYEKFGFRVEGRLKDYVFNEGEYVDAIVMGRLRPTAA